MVQEVFIKIWEKRKTLEISGSVKSYLYASVKNTCLNRLKADKSRRVNTDYFLGQRDKVVDHSEIEQEEFRSQLFKCIEKLPPRCKEVFVQSRFDDLKQEKIAESLDITLKTVKAQIGKALKLLKTCLQPSYPEYF
jgi:RNA polymerase sigma-70 factor (ECF subfamily)